MLPLTVAVDCFRLVPRRRCPDAQFRRGMQLQQFPQGHSLEGPEAPGMLIVEELLRFPRRKALNHTQSILRATLYVNHKSRSLHPSVGAACRGLRSTGCGFCPFPPVPLPVFNFFLDEKPSPADSNSWVKL